MPLLPARLRLQPQLPPRRLVAAVGRVAGAVDVLARRRQPHPRLNPLRAEHRPAVGAADVAAPVVVAAGAGAQRRRLHPRLSPLRGQRRAVVGAAAGPVAAAAAVVDAVGEAAGAARRQSV